MLDSDSLPDCSQNRVPNCWAEIDLGSLAHNVHLLNSPDAPLMAVLKANAYGHGIDIVAPELVRRGVRHFGIATALEGCRLRQIVGSDAEIYVMTAVPPGDAGLLARNRLTPFVSSLALLDALSEAAEGDRTRAAVHLEIDTGIGRAGFEPGEFAAALRHTLNLPAIALTGLCTHFTWGENPDDACAQFERFVAILEEQVPRDLLAALTIHAANSPGLLTVPEARFNLTRPGLLLYGIAPEGDRPAAAPSGAALRPVLTLRARVLLVRDLPAGTPISYGRTYTLPTPARIATIGIGYGDGYSRRFSNVGRVLLPGGAAAPIRGRVCMDQCCVEVPPGNGLSAGDAVTLVGVEHPHELRAAEIAGWIDATPHEITTCLTERITRVLLPQQ